MKPIVLVFCRYYLPGYLAGGPIRSIANMVERLSDSLDFRVVALDRDFGSEEPYADVRHGEWVPRGRALVLHVPLSRFSLAKVAEIVRATPHDVIYLNSFFDFHFTQQVLINRKLRRIRDQPIILAPRGEFSEGALQFKRVKKALFMRLARWLGLYERLTWQASSALEAADIRRAVFGGSMSHQRLVVTGHVAAGPVPLECGVSDSAAPARAVDGPLRVCFLSRITPKKNLDFALRVLAEVRVPVRFTVYGPIEDEPYWRECLAQIAKLPSHVEVIHEGALRPEAVLPALREHDLFLFPTHGENFGHVIYEALRAGLTLLISDQTPWQQLEEQGLGWCLPLSDPAGFARRLEQVASWTDGQRQEAGIRARTFAQSAGENSDALEANRNLFLDALSEYKRRST